MEEKNSKKNTQKVIIIVLIVLILLLLIGITFAWYKFRGFSGNTNSLTTGVLSAENLDIRLDEYDGKTINLINTYPLTDSSGVKVKPYEFAVVNNSKYALNYDVKLVKDEDAIKECGCQDKQLDESVIRYQIIRNGSNIEIDTLENRPDWIVDNYKTLAYTTNEYTLRLWLYEKASNDAMGKHFHAKIEVNVTEDN